MFLSWLDRWDERRAQRADGSKTVTDLALDAAHAFPGAAPVSTIGEFCDHTDRAVADPTFFDPPLCPVREVAWQDGWITFPSSLPSGIEENDIVRAKLTGTGSHDHALIVFDHWNARSRKPQLAHFFARQDITVLEIALPYHLERSLPGAAHADHILSPNLGRTLRSMRQAVLDGRQLVAVLKEHGYGKVSVLGMSLGSWVAARSLHVTERSNGLRYS